MKYFIQPNASAKHGYEFVVQDDAGNETIFAMNKKTGDGYIFVPEQFVEPLNRKLVKFTDFEGKGKYEVTRRDGATRQSNGAKSTPTPKKTLAERGNVLEGDDKKLWQELCKKIERAELIAAAKAEVEAKMAAYNKLLEEAQA